MNYLSRTKVIDGNKHGWKPCTFIRIEYFFLLDLFEIFENPFLTIPKGIQFFSLLVGSVKII